MRPASGRVPLGLLGGSPAERPHTPREGTMRTAMQGTPDGRRTRESALTLSDVCGMQKPLKTPFRGIVSGAAYSAGIAGTAQAYPRRARTGADGARGCRAYIRRARSYAGRWAAPAAIWGGLSRSGIEKAPDGSGAGDYLNRRAALKSVASGSRSKKSRCTVITSKAYCTTSGRSCQGVRPA